MNEIRRTVEKQSRWRELVRRLILPCQWQIKRWLLAWSLAEALRSARRLEKIMQEFEQKRDNLSYAREFDQFHYMKGFCDGIKYCITGQWK